MKRLVGLLILALLAACGGNNKSTSPVTPPPPGDTTSMAYNDRTVALDAVAAKLDSLENLSQQQIAEQILSFVQTRSEFEASGITGAATVWARFTDGRLLIIPNNREQSADTAGTLEAGALELRPPSMLAPRSHSVPRSSLSAQRLQVTQPELPRSMQFQALNSIGLCHLDPIPAIKTLLASGKYIDGGGVATVNGLKNVKGDGIFYIDAHGGQGITRDSLLLMSIWTTNGRTASDELAYADMLRNGELTYMLQKTHDTADWGCRMAVHYGITPFFVSRYMKFSAHSLVFVDACYSDDLDLKAAFTNAGAGVYIGWSGIVDDGAAFKTARCLFDRLLGANMAAPKEDPCQRPFGTDVVMQDLQAHNLVADPAHPGTHLVITPLNTGAVVLAPSVKFLTIADDASISHLYIAGLFGTDPGEGNRRVTVAGQEVTVISWDPLNIECQTPSSGAGSDGPVVVESRANVGTLTPLAYRESNPVNITSWQGQISYDRAETGTLHETMTINLLIRADIHAFRDIPHEQPWETTVLFGDSRESDAVAEASGSVSGSIPGYSWSIAWSGTHNLGSAFSGGDIWGLNGSSIDTKAKMMNLRLLIATDQLTSTLTQTYDPGGTYTFDGSLLDMPDSCLYDEWNSSGVPGQPLCMFYLPLDNAFNVVAGSRSCAPEPYVSSELTGIAKAAAKFEWQQMTVNFPPDPAAAR